MASWPLSSSISLKAAPAALCPPPVLLLAGVYLFFSLVLVVEPHSLRTGLTFLIWSVLGVHFTPLSSIKYGIVLIAFVVIRKHLPEIRRIPKGQACFALRKG